MDYHHHSAPDFHPALQVLWRFQEILSEGEEPMPNLL